jgi:hypothetical protein
MAVSVTFNDSTGAPQVLGGMTAFEAAQLRLLMWRQLGVSCAEPTHYSGGPSYDSYPARAGTYEAAGVALAAIRAPGYVPLRPPNAWYG